MKVAFYTLGCKVNQYETEKLLSEFLSGGFDVVDFSEKADIYIINTCTVTAVSDKKSRQAIRQAKKKNQNGVVVVTGCYPETAKDKVKNISDIDIVVANNDKGKLFDTVISKISYNKIIKNTTEVNKRTRAWLKIEDGCDNFCSYCIIPFARGRVRSRKISDISAEFDALVQKGYKEVILTGIEISSFGKDTGEKLIDLLKALSGKSFRVRLGSLEPRLLTKEFISELSINNICPHFHISLQSGCDTVLERMNRKYTIADYKRCVELLRECVKGCSFTTDIIVGFPGETDEEFQKTCEFVREIGFAKIHIFPYSKREGTKAAVMENQVPKAVKEQRASILSDIERDLRLTYYQSLIGTYVNVLFETCENGFWEGHAEDYTPVKVKTDENLHNEVVKVEISEALQDYCIGKIKST